MADIKELSNQVAGLMDEFGLVEAELTSQHTRVRFSRRVQQVLSPAGEVTAAVVSGPTTQAPVPTSAPQPVGTPISSPMSGIFYTAPSPNAPPFIKEGDSVTAGQVVGLVEAMKVFNEIVSPVSGTVLSIPAPNGSIISPGEPLIFIG